MEFLRSFHVGCLLKLTIASDWLITFWVSTVKFATFFKIVFLHLIFIFLFFPFCTYLPLLVKPLYFFQFHSIDTPNADSCSAQAQKRDLW